jgi:hypothetical protein
MADDTALALRVAELQTDNERLRREIAEHRSQDAQRFEELETAMAETQGRLAHAIRERNDALAALSRRISGAAETLAAADFDDFIDDAEAA